jgi:hypothetical protein
MYACMLVCAYVRMYICKYGRRYIQNIHTYEYIYEFVSMCVCMHVYTCMYVRTKVKSSFYRQLRNLIEDCHILNIGASERDWSTYICIFIHSVSCLTTGP